MLVAAAEGVLAATATIGSNDGGRERGWLPRQEFGCHGSDWQRRWGQDARVAAVAGVWLPQQRLAADVVAAVDAKRAAAGDVLWLPRQRVATAARMVMGAVAAKGSDGKPFWVPR